MLRLLAKATHQMPSNMENKAAPPTLVEMMHINLCVGITAGVISFLKVNRASRNPEKIKAFTVMLTNEYGKGSTYPFDTSLQKEYNAAVEEAIGEISSLFLSGKTEEMGLFCRNLGMAIAIKFLDDQRPQALKVINTMD